MTAWLAAAAGILTSLAVVWRYGARPARRVYRTLVELLEQWRETQRVLDGITQLLAQFAVDFDRRLTLLETQLGVDRSGPTDSLLTGQLVAALRHPARPGGRRSYDPPFDPRSEQ